jgi:hypothetical protein
MLSYKDKQKNVLYKVLETWQHDWLHLQFQHILGKAWTKYNMDNNDTSRAKGLTKRVKEAGHYLHMDNFFSFPDLFYNQAIRDKNCCKLNDKNAMRL